MGPTGRARHRGPSAAASIVDPRHAIQPSIVGGRSGKPDRSACAHRRLRIDRHRGSDCVDGRPACTLGLLDVLVAIELLLCILEHRGGVVGPSAADQREACDQVRGRRGGALQLMSHPGPFS
jgi:hypothetical protein